MSKPMSAVEREIVSRGWTLENDKYRAYFCYRASQGNFHTQYRETPEEVLIDVRKLKGKDE